MKKGPKKYKLENDPENISKMIVSDYQEIYEIPQKTSRKETLTKNFYYSDFKKIADKSPFTLGEWADLLYTSERTLHRYAKCGSDFNGLQIERILLLEKLINAGNRFFGKENFKQWLSFRPFSLNGERVRDHLFTAEEIQNIIDLIGRIQHGIPA